MSLLFALILTTAANQQKPVQHRVPIELFQVIDLPLTITETALVKTKDGYLLQCLISNNSEGLKLREFQTKEVTFKTPLKLKKKTGARLVLMLEEVVSTDYLWAVVKAKENLAAYIAGEYSVAPRVLRLTNQADTPPRRTVIY